MNERKSIAINPSLDLVLTRTTHVPVELVWKAWTTPELLKKWFCPRPWQTTECEMELWPGGRFMTVMQGPEGETFGGEGCILEVIENRRFAWTNGLQPGFRPILPSAEEHGGFDVKFTAIIELEPAGPGTKYTATVLHADPASQQRHAEMGFEGGWGTAFDQLVELMSQ